MSAATKGFLGGPKGCTSSTIINYLIVWLQVRLYHFLCHLSMSVANGSALVGPSWHRWESHIVQCFSCISLLPKPQLQHNSSPLYFLKWTKGEYAATQIPKYHHAIPLMWKYAMPWCREVTFIFMNSLQDFQWDYFSLDDRRLRGKSSERNKTKLWKLSAASKGKCTFDSIPSYGFFPLKMSIGTFLIPGLEIRHENIVKYAFALTLLPEAISQSSADILEPLESFLWDWKAPSQEKAKPPCDGDGQRHRKAVH